MRLALVAIAGGLGALSRYAVGGLFGVTGFPWATLTVNLAGSLLLGVLLTASPDRMSADVRVALAVGFIGAFTTFSTFSYETMALVRSGRVPMALAYVTASLLLGLAGAVTGYRLGQLL